MFLVAYKPIAFNIFTDQNSTGPSLLKVLFKCYGPYYLVGSAMKLIHDILNFASPQLLRLVAKKYLENLILLQPKCEDCFPCSSFTLGCNALCSRFLIELNQWLKVHKFYCSSNLQIMHSTRQHSIIYCSTQFGTNHSRKINK